MFQKMSLNFAFDFMSLNRRDRTPAVSYDNLYSSVHKIMMNTKSQREAHCDLRMIQQLLSSYKPDLNLVSEDEESIQSYKLLLGMSSKLLGDIFLQEDFVTESVTTVLVPLHSKQVKLMLNHLENGSKLSDDLIDLFSIDVSQSSLTKDGNDFDFDSVKSDEVEAEKSIKVEEEGELPVLIKFQNTTKTKKANCPKQKCLQCGKKYRFIDKHTQEKCDKVQARKRKYAKEWEQKNKNRKEEQKEKVTCDLCGKILKSYCLKVHMERWHNPEGRKYYNCDKCAYRCSYKPSLTQHMKNHEGVVLETCHICGGKYKDLDKHIKSRHNSKSTSFYNLRVKCEICGKEIKKTCITTHMKAMHTERKHACHLCSYNAQTKFNLKLHISKSHLGVKELEKEQCPHCDVYTTNLQNHLKTYHPC